MSMSLTDGSVASGGLEHGAAWLATRSCDDDDNDGRDDDNDGQRDC